MRIIFYIVMVIAFTASTVFNIVFAYSNVDCVGCATMLFLTMTALSSVIIAWATRKLYKIFEEGKADLFK